MPFIKPLSEMPSCPRLVGRQDSDKDQTLIRCWSVAGLTYRQLESETPGGSFDRLASLWFVASCMVLQPGNNACTIM
jgi:hypothetical protein